MQQFNKDTNIPFGTQMLISSKLYYGVLSKSLEGVDTERYFSVLYFIQNNSGACCQQNICDHLAIDKTAMVKILDSLVKSGLIERKTNPKDRREHYILLSEKGKKQTKKITKAFEQLDKQMFSGLSEKDIQNFKQALQVMTDNLKSLPANDLFFNYKKTKK